MRPIRTLLADDHEVVRAGIRNALQGIEYIDFVGEVGDGPALFAALKALEPDFLVMDVTMPNFDPLVAIRSIRTDYPKMKILVISAYNDDVYVQGLLGAGVNGYHLKDQPLSELALAVRHVLSGEKWLSGRLVDQLIRYAETPRQPPSLSSRQREILYELQKGHDNRTIAHHMGLSVKTIENHLTRLYRQLDVQSRLEAVCYANQHPEILGVSGVDILQGGDDAVSVRQVNTLVVDDNARYRHQLLRMISKACRHTLNYEAENIAGAVQIAERVRPDLVLIDVVLGDENGIHGVRRIKSVSPSSRIVLISAYPDREFHRQGLAAGAVAFLDKSDITSAHLRQLFEDITT